MNNIQAQVKTLIQFNFEERENINDVHYLYDYLINKYKNKLLNGVLVKDISNIYYNSIVSLGDNFLNVIEVELSFLIMGFKLTKDLIIISSIDDIEERDIVGEKKYYIKKEEYFCYLNNIKSLDKTLNKINNKDVPKDKIINIKIITEPLTKKNINNNQVQKDIITFKGEIII